MFSHVVLPHFMSIEYKKTLQMARVLIFDVYTFDVKTHSSK